MFVSIHLYELQRMNQSTLIYKDIPHNTASLP